MSIKPESPTWKNWSGNIVHNGKDYYFKPTNLTELQSVLASAKQEGLTVRVSGQRHSQPPLVTDDNRSEPVPPTPEELLVDMSCYIDIGTSGIELGPGANEITVNPGIKEDAVETFLTENNLMFQTATAGGFFSIGGMTAVDVHGATVEVGIFAETASSFTIVNAEGESSTIDRQSPAVDGCAPLQFARVSLGGLGIVTRITLDVLPRPFATTLQGGMERYKLKNREEFVAKFKDLLTGPGKHDRVETFYTPYAAAPNLPFPSLDNFLVLWWDVVDNPTPETPNSASEPKSACVLSDEGEFGAPLIGGIGEYAVKFVRKSQYFDSPYSPFHIPPVPPSGYTAISLDVVEKQAKAANKAHSELWLAEATNVMFMSYNFELPNLDDAGLAKVWEGLDAVGEYVIQDDNFHIAAPIEFRFIKAGDSAMSGMYSKNKDAYFLNLDLIGFVEPTSPADYPEALLKFFASVERKWVSMGGITHNGKMFGFYDPKDPDTSSFTPPFNKNFLSFVTEERIKRGAPIPQFKNYLKASDPDGRFYNKYLRALLGP